MSKSIQIWDNFFPLDFPKQSENLKSLDIGLQEVGTKRRLNEVNIGRKKSLNNLFMLQRFKTFLEKKVHIWDHFFPLVFPKDSESLTILDIRLWEVGAKSFLNGTSKVNKLKKIIKKTFFAAAILDHFGAKMIKSETISFHYFAPSIWHLQKLEN